MSLYLSGLLKIDESLREVSGSCIKAHPIHRSRAADEQVPIGIGPAGPPGESRGLTPSAADDASRGLATMSIFLQYYVWDAAPALHCMKKTRSCPVPMAGDF